MLDGYVKIRFMEFRMKDFFSRYSYRIVKMFVTQAAIGLFGAVLAFAVTGGGDTALALTGVFAVLFYLFLIYTSAWEIGATDRVSMDVGKLKRRPWLGFIISLLANIPNLIVATVYGVCWAISHGAEGVATNVAAMMRVVTLFIEGMYYGLLAAISIGTRVDLDGNVVPMELFNYWWAYFVIVIPAIVVCGVGYWLGTKNAKLTTIMDPVYPESDREGKVKKEKTK